MNNKNILITSAGKRVELTGEFQKELKATFPLAKVYTADLNPTMAPACYVSDECFPVPRVTDPKYFEVILDICKKHGIGVIIPTIDTELLGLAQHKAIFIKEGIQILVSDEDFISICRDKRLTMKLFDKFDIKYPKLINKCNPVFPMFAKPYNGSLSSNLHIIRSQEDLTSDILNDESLIFMELIDKYEYKEFTVDMYYGKDNRVKSIVPRERLEVRSGEINKGVTRKNYIIDFLLNRMEYMAGVVGCICIQLFYREKDNDILGIEINPRFGGGFPLSYYAGANFPEMIVKEYIQNIPVDYSDQWKPETLMLRYDSQVITRL